MNKWIAFFALALMLAGCNTVQGMGRDIQQAGEAIQKSSK
jgi:entericidin B